ncbi:hypothetical protein HYX11_01085, partial [Candidatus Woesearchaeota archaeon]|nr:hypothetical protein [Candidatus Woesearchaeota archaeon]
MLDIKKKIVWIFLFSFLLFSCTSIIEEKIEGIENLSIQEQITVKKEINEGKKIIGQAIACNPKTFICTEQGNKLTYCSTITKTIQSVSD